MQIECCKAAANHHPANEAHTMNLELQDPNADEPKDDQSLVESNTEEQDLL